MIKENLHIDKNQKSKLEAKVALSQHFAHLGFCPIWDFVHSGFFPFGILSNSGFWPIRDIVHLGFCPFRNFFQSGIFSNSGFCPLGMLFCPILDIVQFGSSGFCPIFGILCFSGIFQFRNLFSGICPKTRKRYAQDPFESGFTRGII